MSAETHGMVEHALATGHTTVVDPATGYHRSLYADCPHDGTPSPVRQADFGAGHEITRLTMRCPNCGRQFTASRDSLYLR